VGFIVLTDRRYIKVFHSHARDSLGRNHKWIKIIFSDYDNRNYVLFELTGVHIAKTQSETTASRTERPETEQNRTSQTYVYIGDTCNLSAVKQ
jgi:hypothetical protein